MQSVTLRRISVLLLMVAVFATSFMVSAAHASLLERQQTSPLREVAQRNFGSWQYSVVEQDGSYVVAVELTNKDSKGLKNYIQDNIALAANIFKQHDIIQGNVVFRRPVTELELPRPIRTAVTQVRSYELRIRGSKDERFTVFGAPTKTEFLPKDLLAHTLKDIKEKTGSADLRGFTSITMSMNAEQYNTLTGLSDVLLVDIIPAVARNDYLHSSTVPPDSQKVVLVSAPTYWYYEKAYNP